tara:strand:- start:19041 stop:19958 length:918 start_codon:yes stop_codon:yes gene_type:complete
MQQTILVTGGFGFLGRAVARNFKQLGYRVIGIGRGCWEPDEALAHSFDIWLDANISLSSLMTLNEHFDVVVHCGGNGSVEYSLANPLQDFSKTVQGTIELLEYLRVTESRALVIYPSSAGVYGAKEDAPIRETDSLNPISPYGFHKRIAEELVESYSRSYGIRVVVIRFFSIYGAGLTKQLLWDATSKLYAAKNGEVVFWGTGEETRDWIHVADAASLIVTLSNTSEKFIVLNGAGGKRVTVAEILKDVRRCLRSSAKIEFNGKNRLGDPRYYHADITLALKSGWKPRVSVVNGVKEFTDWFKTT